MKTSDPYPPKMDVEEFEIMKVRVMKGVGRFMIQHTDYKVETVMDELFYELRSHVFGQSNIQKYRVWVEIPYNWWEHLKRDHFPEWYINRWPVKMKQVGRVITFDHKKLFPESDIVIDPRMGRMVIHSTSPDYGVNQM